MAIKDRINTAKEVFADTRARMIIIILAIIVVVVLVVAYFRFKSQEVAPAGQGSALTGVPGITSIPGMGDPTREYAKLQEQQNIQLAEEAARRGTAALPTVVRTTYLDIGASSDLTGSESGAGCSIEELKRARAAGVTAAELRCRGCSLAALRAAGFTAGELRAAGFSADELKNAGFSASDLKNAGFSAKDLAAAGFSASDLASAGFTVGELKGAGFSNKELMGAGFSLAAIKAVGEGMCSISKLREARSKGVKAIELRKLGCSAAALRAAGYTAEELKEAGFSAGELKNAGFSAGELKNAGFSASELKNAGFGAKEMTEAGFSADELKNAGFTAGDLVRAGVVAEGLSSALAESASCDVKTLKKARADGISAIKLKKRGCSATALRAAGFTAAELRAAGFSAAELLAAGFSIAELIAAGFTIAELLAAGVSIEDLRKAGFGAKALKAAGLGADDLYAAGFPAEKLKAAGFSDKEVRDATIEAATGKDISTLQDSLAKLKKDQLVGMSAQEMEDFISQQQAIMMMQANQLFAAWTPAPSQRYVEGEMHSVKKEEGGAEAKEGQAVQQQMVLSAEDADIFKAGNIIFAVLDTEVNSDENSPVMATVVQGSLKGAKVIGNFQRVDKKVLLRFSVISVPKMDRSMAINAVAIDPNTDRTALATSVDNHYLLRYGSILGSAFISGLGEAFQNAGSKVTTSTTGSVVTMPALTTAEKTIVAFGNMAQQFGQAIADKIDTPPTIKVAAGFSIGLLLMADLVVPKNQQKV